MGRGVGAHVEETVHQQDANEIPHWLLFLSTAKHVGSWFGRDLKSAKRRKIGRQGAGARGAGLPKSWPDL